MQRLLDLCLSTATFISLLPLLLPVALILKVTGEGEIFYKQERVGKDRKIFSILKFATMLKNSPNIGSGEITLRNDPRVLPFGKFLRKSKINELPQLINIMLGQMSLVGPRPMVPSQFSAYPKHARQKIASVRPGLTGVGSIIFRDEERLLDGLADPMVFYQEKISPYKAKVECWYIDHKSIRLYLGLIILTALVVISPNNKSWKYWLSGVPARDF